MHGILWASAMVTPSYTQIGRLSATGVGDSADLEPDAGAPTISVPLVVGPFAIAAVLLLVSGIAKMSQPQTTVDAMRAAGLPSGVVLVYLLATVEIGVGAIGLLVGGRAAAVAVAAIYLGFGAFVVLTKVRGTPARGCGCLGAKSDTPPGGVHLAVDILAFAAGAVAMARPVPGLFEIMQSEPLAGMVFIGFVALGTWLVAVMLTEWPRLQQVMGEGAS